MVFNNRTSDIGRNITQDANLANLNMVDALVEIHLNSNQGTPGTGTEAFVSVRDIGRSRALANDILQRIEAQGFRNRGVKTQLNSRGEDAFGILRLTTVPAVLLECAFINNPRDMERFSFSAMAQAIADSVCEIFPLRDAE